MLEPVCPAGRFRCWAFACLSGSGKTTLLAELIPHLKFAGLRVSVIKHGHQHH
ncbi:MAG: molybdopterin-guanine dinucleotide biosynthesis protein MobB [Thiolinea sp.]